MSKRIFLTGNKDKVETYREKPNYGLMGHLNFSYWLECPKGTIQCPDCNGYKTIVNIVDGVNKYEQCQSCEGVGYLNATLKK